MKCIITLLFVLFSISSMFCQTLLQEGDACFDSGNYNCAIAKYKDAMSASSGQNRQKAEIKLSRANRCADKSKKANEAFNNNQYSQAKQYYQSVLDGNPKDGYAQNQIARCEAFLKPAPAVSQPTATTKPATATASDQPNAAKKAVETTLTVSAQNIFFNANVGKKGILVTTNANEYQISYLPAWCKVDFKYGSCFSIYCNANHGSPRNDFFMVTAGNKKVTIYVSQEGKTARSANSHKTYNRTSCFNCPKNHEKWGITVGCLQRLC
jgi:tetratricopeptide (TPR) repeat protein